MGRDIAAAAHQPDCPIPSRPESSLTLEDLPFSRLAHCWPVYRQYPPAAIPHTTPPVLCSTSSALPGVVVNSKRRQPTGLSPKFRFVELPSREETKPIRLALFISPLVTYYPPDLAPRLVTPRHWWSACSRSTSLPPPRRLPLLLVRLTASRGQRHRPEQLPRLLHHTWPRYWRQGRHEMPHW